MRTRWPFLVLIPCLLVLNSGCVPGVAWLPDSSGFVYTAGSGNQKLMLFDVAQRQSRVLVADTGAPTLWPAVSPDGKRIAVARVRKADGGGTALQVLVYDLGGKELYRSSAFPWRKTATENAHAEPQLFWAPQEEKLLISADQVTGVYDLKTAHLAQWPGSLLMIFDNTPIRPDGKGFLLTFDRRQKERYAFADWDGRKRDLACPAELSDLSADEERFQMLFWPVVFGSRWDGEVARVRGKAWDMEVDTKRLTVTATERKQREDGKPVIQEYEFPGGKVRLRTVPLAVPKEGAIPQPLQLELLRQGEPSPKVLAKEAHCVLLPSPDRRTVALVIPAGLGRRILVIDQDGATLADIGIDNQPR